MCRSMNILVSLRLRLITISGSVFEWLVPILVRAFKNYKAYNHTYSLHRKFVVLLLHHHHRMITQLRALQPHPYESTNYVTEAFYMHLQGNFYLVIVVLATSWSHCWCDASTLPKQTSMFSAVPSSTINVHIWPNIVHSYPPMWLRFVVLNLQCSSKTGGFSRG